MLSFLKMPIASLRLQLEHLTSCIPCSIWTVSVDCCDDFILLDRSRQCTAQAAVFLVAHRLTCPRHAAAAATGCARNPQRSRKAVPKPAARRTAQRALGTVQAHSNAVTMAGLAEGSAVGIGQTPAYDGALPILRYAPGALTIHELPH